MEKIEKLNEGILSQQGFFPELMFVLSAMLEKQGEIIDCLNAELLAKEQEEISIPELIKSVREEKGLTREEFAELLGFTESSVSQWESGKREAPYDVLEFVFNTYLHRQFDRAKHINY